MARKPLRISLPVLLSEACSENFRQTNENPDCINETFERSVDHLPGHGGRLIGGNHDIKAPH